MKILTTFVIAVLLGAGNLLAHEDEVVHEGLFLGQSPEYLHVLLHPMLIIGLAVSLVVLLAGMVIRSKPSQVIGLSLVLATSMLAWPILNLGQNAYNRVQPQSDEVGQKWAKEHMRRAEMLVYVFYTTSLLAGAALVTHRRFPKAVMPLTMATLLVGAFSLGAGGWISKAGGQIRHPEFRETAPPVSSHPEHSHSTKEP